MIVALSASWKRHAARRSGHRAIALGECAECPRSVVKEALNGWPRSADI